KAVINGQAVAIKIQFPGVADTIDSDVALVRRLAETGLSIAGKNMNMEHVFAELTWILRQEVDYLQEAENLKIYKEAFANDPRYRVPDVFDEFSTRNVLVMSFEEGIKLNDWLKQEVSAEERHQFSENMFGLIMKELFEVGIVQTDS